MTEKVFVPRRGQTDFTNIRWAPVINCVVEYQGKILLVQRSTDLRLYPGFWNGISGFLDDQKSLEEKVYEEVGEELGITKEQILSIDVGAIFDQDEPQYHKTWIVHPVLVRITTDKIQTDWEAEKSIWTTIEEAKETKLLPGFEKVLDIVQQIIKKEPV